MRTRILVATSAIFYLFFGPAVAQPQAEQSASEWGKLGDYGHYYDVESEEAFSSKVVRVHQIYYPRSSKCCIAIEAERSDNGHIERVYLGPQSRLEEIGFQVQTGDEICIIGSRVRIHGRSTVISKQITDGHSVVQLRSQDGRHFRATTQSMPDGQDVGCLTAYALD